MKIPYKTLILPLLAVLAAGCAKEAKSSTNEMEKEYIEAWLKVNYPNVHETGHGIYILEDIPGTGAAYSGEDYVHLNYTTTDLEGTIASTTDKETSKRLGTFSEGKYYGAKIWEVSDNTIPVGIEDMLSGMKIGGTRTAIIPAWLATYNRYKKDSDYIKKSVNTTTSIYTITLEDAFDDIDKWEIDSLAAYAKRNYGLAPSDSLRKGFFYISTKKADSDKEFPIDTTIYINYIGRLLDGTVFDTSVADTAKFYGIYSSSRTYGPVEILWSSEVSEIKMRTASSSSTSSTTTSTPVLGFQYTLWEMGTHEKGTGLFYSPLGYSVSGSGSSIPSFSPLRFDIEVVDKK